MAHVSKFTSSATGHLSAHFERRKGEDGEYIKFGNQNIDTSRTHMNYNLAPRREQGQVEFIQQRLKEVRCQKRDDVKVMCDWVITMPKGYSRADDLLVTMDAAVLERIFFERIYEFLTNRYGEDNVISSYVHKDEVSPHMHFAFIPCTEDKKRGGLKVSAKEVLTKRDLQTFHPDLEEYLDRFHDWHFDVVNEATKDGNKTVADLKKETAHKEVIEYQQRAQKARTRVETLQETILPLEKKKHVLEDEIGDLESRLMVEKEVIALKGKKTLTGALKGVSFEDFQALQRTASNVENISAERDQALARAEYADQRANRVEIEARESIEKAKREMPSMKAYKEIIQLHKENEVLKRQLDSLKTRLTAVFQFLEIKHPQIYNAIQLAFSKAPSRGDQSLATTSDKGKNSQGRER